MGEGERGKKHTVTPSLVLPLLYTTQHSTAQEQLTLTPLLPMSKTLPKTHSPPACPIGTVAAPPSESQGRVLHGKARCGMMPVAAPAVARVPARVAACDSYHGRYRHTAPPSGRCSRALCFAWPCCACCNGGVDARATPKAPRATSSTRQHGSDSTLVTTSPQQTNIQNPECPSVTETAHRGTRRPRPCFLFPAARVLWFPCSLAPSLPPPPTAPREPKSECAGVLPGLPTGATRRNLQNPKMWIADQAPPKVLRPLLAALVGRMHARLVSSPPACRAAVIDSRYPSSHPISHCHRSTTRSAK